MAQSNENEAFKLFFGKYISIYFNPERSDPRDGSRQEAPQLGPDDDQGRRGAGEQNIRHLV